MNGIDLLLTRRSVIAKVMEGPGPDDADLEKIITAGLRVPDHGKLTPWRLHVIRGEARQRFGEVLKSAYQALNPEISDEKASLEAEKPMRAPLIIAVVSVRNTKAPIPEMEQLLSAGAVCLNLITAATALGHAAQWITEWPAYNDDVKKALGYGPEVDIAGFVYLGSRAEAPAERPRPDRQKVVFEWTEPAN